MKIYQTEFRLPPFSRGFHLITDRITAKLPELSEIRAGQLHIFIKHTSASVCLNENAEPDVRRDFERWFNATVSEETPYFEHTYEGPDDMPAHIKNALLGSSLLIPVTAGRLNLGTWQGVYLCEHRNRAAGRSLVLTLSGI